MRPGSLGGGEGKSGTGGMWAQEGGRDHTDVGRRKVLQGRWGKGAVTLKGGLVGKNKSSWRPRRSKWAIESGRG